MHLKNWSVLYADTRTASIAPAYDFVSTIGYIKNDKLALNFADTKAFADLDVGRFDRFASRAKLSSTLVRETAKDTIARFHAAWASRKDLPISADLDSAIEAHLKQVPIAKQRD
jgi:serine/threonine-protein kinase HipA